MASGNMELNLQIIDGLYLERCNLHFRFISNKTI
jgi:hypothetical protein